MSDLKSPITRKTLHLSAIRFVLLRGLILVVAVPVMGVAAYYSGETELALSNVVFLCIAGSILTLLILTVLTFLLTLKSFNLIAKQEAFFGLNFHEEMERFHITEPVNMNRDWFIDASTTDIIVLRRAFIVDIKWRRGGIRFTSQVNVIVIGADGIEYRISASRHILNNLLKWFTNPEISN